MGGVRGSLPQVARTVVAAHGVGALYRGFRASLLGDILGNSLGEPGNVAYVWCLAAAVLCLIPVLVVVVLPATFSRVLLYLAPWNVQPEVPCLKFC